MSRKAQNLSAIKKELIKFELIEGLKHGINENYRRLRDLAKNEWDRRLPGKDPSDVCVNVRIARTNAKTNKASTLQSAGFTKKRGLSANRQTRPRLARTAV